MLIVINLVVIPNVTGGARYVWMIRTMFLQKVTLKLHRGSGSSNTENLQNTNFNKTF